MIDELFLEKRTNDLCQKERQNVYNAIHNFLTKSDQIVEVQRPIFFFQSIANLNHKRLSQLDFVALVEPIWKNGPEEVDN